MIETITPETFPAFLAGHQGYLVNVWAGQRSRIHPLAHLSDACQAALQPRSNQIKYWADTLAEAQRAASWHPVPSALCPRCGLGEESDKPAQESAGTIGQVRAEWTPGAGFTVHLDNPGWTNLLSVLDWARAAASMDRNREIKQAADKLMQALRQAETLDHAIKQAFKQGGGRT